MTDNVLVSREKWEALLNWVWIDSYKSVLAKEILAMPDFVESEEDVKTLRLRIETYASLPTQYSESTAQAAINALKPKEKQHD